jgi:hypothetical protein
MTSVLLTGVPRSGTTLCCHLLNRFTNTVALHEPINPAIFDNDRVQAIQNIASFCTDARSEILKAGTITTKQLGGELPTNPVDANTVALRKEKVTLGRVKLDTPLTKDFKLVVKHNALFTALLEDLVKVFDVYAVIRNPLDLLISWQTVDLPVNRGHIPMGERFDPALSASLNQEGSVLQRQVKLIDWFFKRYATLLATSKIIRYEDLIASSGECLKVIANSSVKDPLHLSPQTQIARTSSENLTALRNLLLSNPSVVEPYYSTAEIESEYRRLKS